jgi:hypothetical protein
MFHLKMFQEHQLCMKAVLITQSPSPVYQRGKDDELAGWVVMIARVLVGVGMVGLRYTLWPREPISVNGGKVAISFHLHGELNVLVLATHSLDLSPLHVGYRGIKYALSGESPASTLSASFCYLCSLIPHHMPLTHSLDLSPLHVGSLPNTPLYFFLVFFLDQQSHLFLGQF